jgi:hypothetical protein
MLLSYWKVFAIMIFGYILHWLPNDFKNRWMNIFIDSPVYAKVAVSAAVVFIVYQSVSAGLQPFIYFRF